VGGSVVHHAPSARLRSVRATLPSACGWRAEGIGVIVSLLEAGEVEELGLHREAGLCHDLDMEYISFPAPDGGAPASTREAMALAEAIVACLNERNRAIVLRHP
jgi:hypothetical protein